MRVVSPLIRSFLLANLEKFPAVIRQCPLKGRIELWNITPSVSMMGFMPVALYKMKTDIYDDKNEKIVFYSIQIDVHQSDDVDFFGNKN
jgi:hypothetical protein